MRAIAIALLWGCSYPVTMPRQPEATAIAWQAFQTRYSVNHEPPGIMWEPSDCTAHGLQGIEVAGQCIAGRYLPDEDTIQLVWLGSFHVSAFAHELLHAWQAYQGIYDYGHTRAEWREVLPEVNAELDNKGM